MPGMKPVDKAGNPGLAKLPKEVRNKMGYMNKGGTPTKFKLCSKCPSPAKCKAAGKCLMKGSKKAATGMLVIPVSMTKARPKKAKKS
jgi:hypothetical protein